MPIIRPNLVLDFANSQQLDPRITFTRASTGGRTNKLGLYETVGAGQPRFDFDPITLACKGLLIEEQRTNSLNSSSNMTSLGLWVKQGALCTSSDAIAAPDGSVTSQKLIEDTSASTNHKAVRGGVISAGSTYTLSIYAKAAERTRIVLATGTWTAAWAGTGTCQAIYDLSSGLAVGTPSSSGILTAGAQTIVAVGGGWYRCAITIVAAAGDSTNSQAEVQLVSGTTTNYTGDGASGVYLWGAQLELGAFPTTYIPSVDTFLSRPSPGTFIGSDGQINYQTYGNALTLNDVSLGGATNNGNGTYSIPPSTTLRFLYALIDLVQGATYQCDVNVVSVASGTSASADWCDGPTRNYVPVAGMSLGVTSARGAYDSTYRFFDISTDASTSLTVGTPVVRQVLAGHERKQFNFQNLNAPAKTLFETAATNMLMASNSLTDPSWFATLCVPLSNALLSPDGTTTATKLVETLATGSHGLVYNYAYNFGLNTYTYSAYLKAGERNFAFLWIDNGSGIGITAEFNLTTGTSRVTRQGASWTASITRMELAPNGFTRCSITVTSTVETNIQARVYFAGAPFSTGSFGTFEYTGDNSSGIYVWGQQLEVGSFPTSYIPTKPNFLGRTSPATFIGSNGLVQIAASGALRQQFSVPQLGSLELVSNGTFNTDTAGWINAYQSTISNVGQKLRVTAVGGTNPYARQLVTVVPGKTYRVTTDAKISPTGNNTWKLNLGSTTGIASTEYFGATLDSAINASFTATTTVLNIAFMGNNVTAGDYADFDNISVRELINPSALSYSPYPFYESGSNSLVSSKFESWPQPFSNAFFAPFATTAPDGSATGCLYGRTNASNSYLNHSATKPTTAIPYTLSLYAKRGAGNFLAFRIQTDYPNRSDFTFDLNNGVVSAPISVSHTNAVASIAYVGNGWYRCVATTVTDAGTGGLLLCVSPHFDPLSTVDGSDNQNGASVYLWGAQFEQAASASSYMPTAETFNSRASTGTFINSAGNIASAAINAARLSYNPLLLTAPPALLNEAAATNLLTNSSAFSSGWARTSDGGIVAPVLENYAVAPDGTSTAALFSPATAGTAPSNVSNAASNRIFRELSPIANGAYSNSIYVKTASVSSDCVIYVVDAATDLVRGKFALTSVSTWTRISASGVTSGAASGVRIVFSSSHPVLIWGAQAEAGSFATSYIPTTTTAVTRTADSVTSVAGSRAADSAYRGAVTRSADAWTSSASTRVGDSASFASLPFYRVSEGTVFVEFSRLAGSLPMNLPLLKSNSAIYGILYTNPSQIKSYDGTNAPTSGISNNFTDTTTSTRVAVGYSSSGIQHAANGAALTGTSAFNGTSAEWYDGKWLLPAIGMTYFSKLTYYPKRLSNQDLQAITL